MDNTEEYTYLGITIHKSGLFTKSIRDLATKAERAFFCMKSMLKECSITPRLYVKLFDSLVQPVLLYCCEVWGGFGLKKRKDINKSLFLNLMTNDKTPFEKLNIKLSKQSLKIPRRASNFACRAELGRFPIMRTIIVAILKYNMRLKTLDNNDLVIQAYLSQKNRHENSYKTYVTL